MCCLHLNGASVPASSDINNIFHFSFQGGIYTLPSHLSGPARDLIPRMLVVDPMKRITIREIREHPWFEAQLPRYLAVPPPDTAQQVKKVYLALCTASFMKIS